MDEKIITIDDGEDVNHITKVLRLRTGDLIEVTDGNGIDYIADIVEINKKIVTAQIKESYINTKESSLTTVLFQSIAKGQKMDLIIQKCTELGITDIVPIVTERTVVKLEGEKEERKKQERWQKIALEACKQSKRGKIPKVHLPLSYNDAIQKWTDLDLIIVPYEQETSMGIGEALKSKQDISKVGYFIGPEGGFEQKEIQYANQNGIISVKAGPRILRTETAAIVVLSLIMYQLGDLGGI